MLKKRVLCAALCVLLCLPAGCGKPSEPPTLTPTPENAYVTIDYVGVSEDGTVCSRQPPRIPCICKTIS